MQVGYSEFVTQDILTVLLFVLSVWYKIQPWPCFIFTTILSDGSLWWRETITYWTFQDAVLILHNGYSLQLPFSYLRGFPNSFHVTWWDQQTTSWGLEKTLIKIARIKRKPKKDKKGNSFSQTCFGKFYKNILTISQHSNAFQIFFGSFCIYPIKSCFYLLLKLATWWKACTSSRNNVFLVSMLIPFSLLSFITIREAQGRWMWLKTLKFL